MPYALTTSQGSILEAPHMRDLLRSPNQPRTRRWYSEPWRHRPSAGLSERWLLLLPLATLYLLYTVYRVCAMPAPWWAMP